MTPLHNLVFNGMPIEITKISSKKVVEEPRKIY